MDDKLYYQMTAEEQAEYDLAIQELEEDYQEEESNVIER